MLFQPVFLCTASLMTLSFQTLSTSTVNLIYQKFVQADGALTAQCNPESYFTQLSTTHGHPVLLLIGSYSPKHNVQR